MRMEERPVRGDVGEGERVAGHLASGKRHRVVAVQERPPVRLREDGDEVLPVEAQEVGEPRAAVRLAGRRQRHLTGDDEAVEPQVHRKRAPGHHGAVVQRDPHVPVGLD